MKKRYKIFYSIPKLGPEALFNLMNLQPSPKHYKRKHRYSDDCLIIEL